MAKFVQLKDAKTGEPIYPIGAIPNELTEEEIEAICDFEQGMTEDDVIPKATKSALGCVVVGDGLEVDGNGVLSNARGWDLLWENASPTSAFAAQTISLDLSEYDMVAVEYIMVTSSYYHKVVVTPIADNKIPICGDFVFGTGGKIAGFFRGGHLTKTGIEYSVGWQSSPSSDVQNNNANVPVAIYGIKGVS